MSGGSVAGIIIRNNAPYIYTGPYDPYAGASFPSGPYPGSLISPPGSADVTIYAGASVIGTNAISLARDPANLTGFVSASVTNSGTLSGTAGAAIVSSGENVYFNTIVNQTSGSIAGVAARFGSIDNLGTIDGGTRSAVASIGSTSLSLRNTGTIRAEAGDATVRMAVPQYGYSQITNSGLIANRGTGDVISIILGSGSTSTIQNETSGTISAASGIAIRGTNLSIGNQGSITGGAVAIAGTGYLQLSNSGTITGSITVADGSILQGSRIDTSRGTINGSINLGAADDLLIMNLGTAANPFSSVTGTIDGGGGRNTLRLNISQSTSLGSSLVLPTNFQVLGLGLSNNTIVTLEQGLAVPGGVTIGSSGYSSGAGLINRASLTTTGTAFSSDYSTYDFRFQNEGSITANLTDATRAAVSFENIGRFSNAGTITGIGGIGAQLSGYSGTFTNSGTISGSTVGVALASRNLTNTGQISSGGVGIGLLSGGRINNAAGGTITGGNAAIAATGGQYSYITQVTVTNEGAINGNVDLRGGSSYGGPSNNIFYARAGSVLNGNLNLGWGGDLFVTSLTNNGTSAFSGVTGTVTGGGSEAIRYIVDRDAAVQVTPPGGIFTAVGYDLSGSARLNLTAPSPQALNLDFAGTGTVDLNATITGMIRLDRVSVQTNGTTDVALPTALVFTSRGILTGPAAIAYQPQSSAAVVVGSASSFTNAGTINVGGPVNFFTSLVYGTGIAGSGSVTNTGTINLNGGTAISLDSSPTGRSVVNSGFIFDNTTTSSGIRASGAITNTGTIRTGRTAVTLIGDAYRRPTTLINSGTIESRTGVGVSAEGYYGAATLRNLAGGSISGGSGSFAVSLLVGSTLDNAGTITGNVTLNSNRSFGYGDGSTFISRGDGIVTGDLTLGRGNDNFISVDGRMGVSGTIDAGDGFDTFAAAFTTSTSTTIPTTLRAGFEGYGIGSFGRDVTVTVNGPAGGLATPVAFFGDGRIVNRADVQGIFDPDCNYFTYSCSSNTVGIGQLNGAAGVADALDFVNEARLIDGVAGTARAFLNTGTIGSSRSRGAVVNLRPDTGDSFSFSNGGTITSGGTSGLYGFASAVSISNQVEQTLGSFMTITNSGTIDGGLQADVRVAQLAFSNAGTISAQTGPYYPAVYLNVGLPFYNINSDINSASDMVAVSNRGQVTGGFAVVGSTRALTIENNGSLAGNAAYGATGLSVDVRGGSIYSQTSALLDTATIRNSGTITNGASLIVAARTTTIENTGTISNAQGALPDFVEVGSALAFQTVGLGDQAVTITNRGTITNSRFDGSGIIANIAAASTPASAPSALAGDGAGGAEMPAQANVTILNSGSISANGGATIGQSQEGGTTLDPVAAIGAFAVATGNSSVSITNEAGGSITANGALRTGNADEPSLHPIITGVPSGFGSIAVVGLADRVTITNSGTINGGPGGTFDPTTSVSSLGLSTTETATVFPDRYIAGAIQTFASSDVVVNNAGGTINGSTDLGALDDSLTNAGIINGNVFLRDGNDRFNQIGSGVTNGIVDGGAGTDALSILSGSTGGAVALDRFVNFESVSVAGAADLALSGATSVSTINLMGGSITIATGNALLTSGPITITGGTGDDRVTNAGTIAGTVSLGDGANRFTNSATGAVATSVVSGSGNDVITNAGRIAGNVATGAGDDVFTNGGSVAGTVDLGAGRDHLVLTGAGIFASSVSGGTGVGAGQVEDDVLVLSTGGTDTTPAEFNLATFTNFERLRVNSGVSAVSGNGSFGALEVLGGRLIYRNGSVLSVSGGITIAAGSTFGTAGIVNSNIVVNGTLAPGASPGTMTVNGAVNFASGSTALFELTPTVSDLLAVNGTVTIANGATLTLIGSRPLVPGAPLDLITATGGITGSFATVNRPASILGFLRQQGNAIQLLGLFPVDPAFNPQTRASVNYFNAVLQSNQASGGLIAALPRLVNAAGSSDAAAFARLNPEAYASATQISVENGLAIAASFRSRQSGQPGGKSGLYSYAQGFGNWRQLPGNAAIGTSRANVNDYGVVGGLGYAGENISLSAFIGAVDGSQSIDALGARTTAHGVVFGLTAEYVNGGFRARVVVARDRSSAQTTRLLPTAATTRSAFAQRAWISDLSVSYRHPIGRNWIIEPEAALTTVLTQRGAAVEASSSPFDLAAAARRSSAMFLSGSFSLRGGQDKNATVSPFLSAGVQQQLRGNLVFATAQVVGATTSFTVEGVRRAETLGTVGAGVMVALSRQLDLFAGYRGEFGGGTTNHSANGGLRLRF